MKLTLCVISFFVPALFFFEVRTQQIHVVEDRTSLGYSRGPDAETSNKEIRSRKDSCRGAMPCQSTTRPNCKEVSIEKGTEQMEISKEYTRIHYANGSEAEDVNKTIKSFRNPSREVPPCQSFKDNCTDLAQCSVEADNFLFRPDVWGYQGCSSSRSNATCIFNQTSGGWGGFYVAIDSEEIPEIQIFNFTIYGPTGLMQSTTNLTATDRSDPNVSGIARYAVLSFWYVISPPPTTPTLFRFTLRASESDKFYKQYPYNIACFEKRFMVEPSEQRELY